MQTCIWPSWCHCHSLSHASVKSRLVLPFWYWLTWVVSEKGLLNGCVYFFWFVLSLCICIFVYCFVCQYQSSDWLWRPPLKWPRLCWVGCKTLLQLQMPHYLLQTWQLQESASVAMQIHIDVVLGVWVTCIIECRAKEESYSDGWAVWPGAAPEIYGWGGSKIQGSVVLSNTLPPPSSGETIFTRFAQVPLVEAGGVRNPPPAWRRPCVWRALWTTDEWAGAGLD